MSNRIFRRISAEDAKQLKDSDPAIAMIAEAILCFGEDDLEAAVDKADYAVALLDCAGMLKPRVTTKWPPQ